MTLSSHQFYRHRRLRQTPAIRDLLREVRLHQHDFIAPLFVTDSKQLAGPIAGLPGVSRHYVGEVGRAVEEVSAAGIRGVILFGVPATKTADAFGAWDEHGVVPQAIRAVRSANPNLVIAADVCLCQYTNHGHCGLLDGERVLNDETLETLGRVAVAYANAGASIVAPSGMMDGGVKAIRNTLDEHGSTDVGILAYSVKHASALYGPFREAARSTPASGDRRSHQLDSANWREAMREATSDVAEGADIVMVKPALTNLDTLVRLRTSNASLPLAAYEVSGEYAMLEAAAMNGWLDRRNVALETLTAIKRAGADMIITYRAVQAANWLRETETA